MIRRTIRLMWRGAILAFLVYVLFFVQLGERSAFEHLMRVVNTDEAQDMFCDGDKCEIIISESLPEQQDLPDEVKTPQEEEVGTPSGVHLLDSVSGLPRLFLPGS